VNTPARPDPFAGADENPVEWTLLRPGGGEIDGDATVCPARGLPVRGGGGRCTRRNRRLAGRSHSLLERPRSSRALVDAAWRRLTDGRHLDEAAAWSPDGSQILFTSDRTGRRQVFVMDADGSHERNLSRDAFDDEATSWR